MLWSRVARSQHQLGRHAPIATPKHHKFFASSRSTGTANILSLISTQMSAEVAKTPHQFWPRFILLIQRPAAMMRPSSHAHRECWRTTKLSLTPSGLSMESTAALPRVRRWLLVGIRKMCTTMVSSRYESASMMINSLTHEQATHGI